MERVVMTKKGNEALREELKLLKSKERSKIIKAIAQAREFGDLKENAEYHAAKEKQSFVEGRIKDIETKLSNAEIIDVTSLDIKDRVVFGSTIELENIAASTLTKYQIVGEDEASIENGMISYKAPISRAIIGKNLNDVIKFDSDAGQEIYKIQKIEYI
ncbi:MAG TPA: transcription elongation factor GreA [Gammaproteobacteria bacterium]|nr:transcription elongation factor GreA [Gammaproteobacteria bacterium]